MASCSGEREGVTAPAPESEQQLDDASRSETGSETDFSDPGLWLNKMTDSDEVNMACVMSKSAVDRDAKEMSKDAEGRAFSSYLTYSKSPCGREKTERDWIIYSSSKKALFCLPCLLFFFKLDKCTKSN